MSNSGKKVAVHYRGTLDDGTEFDSSYKRNEPLKFTCMAGMMIPGFDKAVESMGVGETVNVRLEPEEAYGPTDPNMIIAFPIAQVPNPESMHVGDQVMLRDNFGQPVPGRIAEITSENISVDLNHEMAGKVLNFEITLLSAE